MKTWIAAAVLGCLFLSPRLASADDWAAYQRALLQRPLSASDQGYCDRKVGARGDSNKDRYDQCHVTRQFIVDLTNQQDKAFPPLSNPDFLRSDAEANLYTDAITKYQK